MGVPTNRRSFTYFKYVHASTTGVRNFNRKGEKERTKMLCKDATRFVEELRQGPDNMMDWDQPLDTLPVFHVGRCTHGINSRKRQERA